MSVGLLILRLVVGLSLAAHGAQKLFGWFGGYEYTLVLGGAALALAFTGPGAVSVDRALGISWSRESWGLAALAAGLIGAAVPLIARKTPATSTAQNAA